MVLEGYGYLDEKEILILQDTMRACFIFIIISL
jgi:hypothetical protein